MRFKTAAALAVFVAAIGLGACGGSDKPEKKSAAEIIEDTRPSVIKIEGKTSTGLSGGSGVIIDKAKGLALTNAHVVQGLTAIKATVNDKTTVPAQVVATAPCDDVAVIKLTTVPPDAEEMKLGDSKAVKNGDSVIVLGYPGSLEDVTEGRIGATKLNSTNGTVSAPLISAKIDDFSAKFPAVIQHQAPVNHGNSGGPLVNEKGELIGLNTLTGADGAQTQGQYYAIAQDHINRTLLPSLKAGKSIADLGLNLAPLSDEILQAYFSDTQYSPSAVAQFLVANEDTDGLVVIDSTPGSPAREAELVAGDYITEVNGTPIKSQQDVCDVAASATPGQSLEFRGRYLASAEPDEGIDVGDRFKTTLKVK